MTTITSHHVTHDVIMTQCNHVVLHFMASYTTWLVKSVPLCKIMELYWTSFWTIFLVLVIGSVTVIFIVLVYSGLFYRCKIHCTFPASLPTKTAYRCFVGPYKNCAGVFWKLNALMPKSRLFGIYYDDPDTVGKSRETSDNYVCVCVFSKVSPLYTNVLSFWASSTH